MQRAISILPAGSAHEAGWRALWPLYCGHMQPAPEITDVTWRRILDPNSPMGAVMAVADSEVVGFIIFVTHECTWELKPVCYVEDLYVAKRFRGSRLGIAVQMGQRLIERLQAGEWSRLYGITHADNILAQRLYAPFTAGEPYLRYVLKAEAS